VEAWIVQYGYIGVAIGTFFEGEATVLLGGVFSKLGYLNLPKVVAYACTGTFLGDCTFFFLGKLLGRTVIDRYDMLRSRTPFADTIIRRHGHLILFMMRFLAGFRSVILLLLGCTNMSVGRFLIIDFLMVVLWAGLLSLLGFTFGNVIFIFVSDAKRYDKLIVSMVVASAFLGILLYRYFVRRKERERNGS
jgi:membrane protein DedA with SNARE-associated domain